MMFVGTKTPPKHNRVPCGFPHSQTQLSVYNGGSLSPKHNEVPMGIPSLPNTPKYPWGFPPSQTQLSTKWGAYYWETTTVLGKSVSYRLAQLCCSTSSSTTKL